MKKQIIIFFVLLLSAGLANAQLKVANNGKVGVNIGTSTPLSRLSVSCTGDTLTEVAMQKSGINSINDVMTAVLQGNTSLITPQSYCLKATNDNMASQDVYAISAKTNMSLMGKCIGINSEAGPNEAFDVSSLPSYMQGLFQSKSYGVYATAKNLTNGYNYGVFGAITGTRNGAGIYGATSETSYCIPGKYAGYFYGQTRVNGTFYATNVTETSDERVKTNINPIKEDALSAVERLNPVQFQFRQVEIENAINDSTSEKFNFFSPDMDFDRLHYGFIAQEVQKLYPNLVYRDGNGFLGMNYTELIPLLVMAIQELKEEITNLQTGEPEKKQMKRNGNLSYEAVLYQNNPNPFDVATEIRYYLPADMQDAALYIYDMNGTQISKHPLTQTGEGALTIKGNELQAGMYLYSLIADGQVIDTKRMILTK